MTWKTTGADPEALYNGTEFPSLDLKFADNKTLVDEISGQNLITFTRSSIGTYVDANGVIQTASTDTPRFDHDPVTGESLGLLIEEARTNLITDSASSNNWDLQGGGTTNVSSTVCPDGSTDATRITAVALNDGASKQFSAPTSGNYIGSCYARTRTGVAVNVKVAISGLTGPTVTLPADGTWVRVVGSVSNLGVGVKYLSIRSANADMDIDVWGLQAELGSFPTSYIPTSGSTVTRAADVAEITGSNFSSWYNQNEGTVFVQSSGNSARIVGVNDGTDANRHELFYTASGSRIDVFQKAAGVNQVNITILSSSKSAFGYATNNYNISSGGAIGTPDTSANTPTVTQLSIGCWYNDTSQLNGHISRLTYYPYRLSDTRLQTITT